ncbi:outer membrane protein [Oceanomicrobium pacificus]|uniref:Outer membrane beta-barrel protein n=1 Tax=Oceanomicrobium pacificus TaxID=2692916 RepID=A0A6B0TVF1_9RHOB|nr:outer membrane beta-barrel protein [Oceanomicrobium pacificus]MXU64953.1 outer membrane beta-barrel protein [Oceanomicrobium pacificus]
MTLIRRKTLFAPYIAAGLIGAAGATGAAQAADQQLSFYGGLQTAPHSVVQGVDSEGNAFDFTAAWDGKSFEMPPYWGVRYNYWRKDDWGLSLDFSHSKVYSDDATRDDNGFEVLEFTDGLNVLTVNAMRRFSEPDRAWTPYVGAGLGITVPHVEVQADGGARTNGYQFGGYAAQAQVGVDYALSDRWSVFAEYKFNYTSNDVELKNGGNLETDIITNAINLGVSFGF